MFLTVKILKQLILSQDRGSLYVICGSPNSVIFFKIYQTQFLTESWILTRLDVIFAITQRKIQKHTLLTALKNINNNHLGLTKPVLNKKLIIGCDLFDINTNTDILNATMICLSAKNLIFCQ